MFVLSAVAVFYGAYTKLETGTSSTILFSTAAFVAILGVALMIYNSKKEQAQEGA